MFFTATACNVPAAGLGRTSPATPRTGRRPLCCSPSQNRADHLLRSPRFCAGVTARLSSGSVHFFSHTLLASAGAKISPFALDRARKAALRAALRTRPSAPGLILAAPAARRTFLVTPRAPSADAALLPAREKHRLAYRQALLFRLRLAKCRAPPGCSLARACGRSAPPSQNRADRLLRSPRFCTGVTTRLSSGSDALF